MGAELSYRIHNDGPKAVIAKHFSEAVLACQHENGHCYSGGIGMLGEIDRWQDKELPGFEDAEDFLANNHQKWDGAMAVSYFAQTNDEPTKKWVIGGWCSS